jgi:cell division protease FtsH
MHWLQNNNNNTPQRQQNPLRPGPGPGGRPNGNGPTPPAGPSLVNRWLLIVVGVMLAVYIYMYFNSNTSVPNTSQRDELSYSAFYDQITSGNIKSATLIGTTDIQGDFNHPVNGYSQYHVVQLPNGDPQIVSELIKSGATVVNQPPADNGFWLNLLIAFLPWVFLFGLFIFFSRRATQGQQGIFSFGKSRAKLILEDRPSTTIADVAGVDESKY